MVLKRLLLVGLIKRALILYSSPRIAVMESDVKKLCRHFGVSDAERLWQKTLKTVAANSPRHNAKRKMHPPTKSFPQ